MKRMLDKYQNFSITKKLKIKTLYFSIWIDYGKFKNSKMSYIFEKTLVASIICSKYKN